jgi:hypothetical protein
VRKQGPLKNDKNVVSFAQLLAMAKYQKSEGYDPVMYWTRLDLRRIYKTEGSSTREAIRMAGLLYEGIRQLNRKEIYSWSKARELEESSGNASDLEEIAANYAFAHFAFADEVWEEIERMAITDSRELAHYERLRGKQMRLSPEVKAARKRARAEERQRQKEAEKDQWFQWLLERATELRVELKETEGRERRSTEYQRSD